MRARRISAAKTFKIFSLAAPVIANAAVFSNPHWQLICHHRHAAMMPALQSLSVIWDSVLFVVM